MATGKKQNRLKKALKFLLTVVISGACLYFAARRIEFHQLKADLEAMTPALVILAAGVSLATIILRALRWHQVLQHEKKFTFSNSLWATAVGYLANNILPARAGELVRSVMLGLSADIRKSLVLATALTERILDAAILLLLAFLMLNFAPNLPDKIRNAWYFLLPVIGGLMALVFLAPRMQAFWLKLVNFMPVGATLLEKTGSMLVGLIDGVRVFYNLRLLAVFIALSIVVWMIDATGLLILARALGSEITLSQSILFIAALGFASSVPSTPGYVGVYQAVAVLILPVFGVSEHRAFLLVSVFQVSQLVVTALTGIPGWIIMQRRIGAARLEAELADDV
jgi:glycosyltransferase 2 family protein